MKKYKKILAHVPYSSLQDYSYGWCSSAWMFETVKRWTEWHTELLFHSPDPRVEMMVFPHSRFFVDVERLDNDPLETIGQGKTCKQFNDLKRSLLKEGDIERLNAVYYDWRRQCTKQIDDDTLVVDCRSFPSDMSPDITACIGFNDDASRPDDDVIDVISSAFTKLGYKVAFNAPYSNSVVFDRPHHSVTIALKKSIYMDEESFIMDRKAYVFGGIINNIYRALLSDENDSHGQ